MLSICLATYNRLPYLKNALNSVFNGFKDIDYPYELLIADGGSTDGTLEYLRELDNVRLVEQGELTGPIKANNICFKLAKGDYITGLNDDFLFYPSAFVKVCKIMDQDEQIGLLVPKMQEAKRGKLHNVLLWCEPYWIISPKIYLYRTDVFRKIGFFDENFRGYLPDVDTPLSILNLGYTIGVTKDVGVFHYRVEDANRALVLNRKRYAPDREYLRQKWMTLEKSIAEYLQQHPNNMYKSLFFKKFGASMYHPNRLHPLMKKYNRFSMKIYDWLLKQIVLFKDTRYNNHKDVFLMQRYPSEILAQRCIYCGEEISLDDKVLHIATEHPSHGYY